MPKVKEFVDNKGKIRINQTADNGKLVHSSHQGYHNLEDAIESTINSSIYYLRHYRKELTIKQRERIISSLNRL